MKPSYRDSRDTIQRLKDDFRTFCAVLDMPILVFEIEDEVSATEEEPFTFRECQISMLFGRLNINMDNFKVMVSTSNYSKEQMLKYEWRLDILEKLANKGVKTSELLAPFIKSQQFHKAVLGALTDWISELLSVRLYLANLNIKKGDSNA